MFCREIEGFGGFAMLFLPKTEPDSLRVVEFRLKDRLRVDHVAELIQEEVVS